jgi:phage terminase Nu1 subunit (DNA packaging protein)
MAEEEFEVHGAHDHAVHHMAEHHAPLGQSIALFSAILATMGAVVSLLGNSTQTEALDHKNEALLSKAQASDNWAYYQAEDLKRHMAELGAQLAPAKAAQFEADVEKYRGRADTLRLKAEKFDQAALEADRKSREDLTPHGKLAIATTALQIAIALASITALTRRRWLLWAAAAFAASGVVLTAFALTQFG